MSFSFVTVSGLPRAGSTLLCQLLAEHPRIYCEGHSSPVCNAALNARRFISADSFFLSQLDTQFDTTYRNLHGAMSGFIRGWYRDAGAGDAAAVIDKNRAWLQSIEFLLELEPQARILVPIRELGQAYGSIETRHHNTQLIDFTDHLADLDRFGRAERLFSREQALGAQLLAINAVLDLPAAVQEHILFVRFEELVRAPQAKMAEIFKWLGVEPHAIDTAALSVRAHESDSHYRHKYTHQQYKSVRLPQVHAIPPRIQASIERAWPWYYQKFYPWVETRDSRPAGHPQGAGAADLGARQMQAEGGNPIIMS